MAIILSADSTCDLGLELKEQFEVSFYPFHIIYKGEDYLDNVTITPEDFYQGYYEDGTLPSTAAINMGEYLNYFQELVADGNEVIHINLASSLSSAHQNAVLAAQQIPGVYVVDGCNLSTGLGLMVIHARECIDAGMDAPSVVKEIENIRPRVHSSFVMDTMDFMAAGGRCPEVLAQLASPLKIKLGLKVDPEDGSMSVGSVYRGKYSRVIRKYVETTLDRYDDIIPKHVFITNSGMMEDGMIEMVQEIVEEKLHPENVYITKASCTISCHCGPNSLGVLFVTES